MAKVNFTSRLVSDWVPETERDLDAAALAMATDVHRGAVILAPKQTRNLVNSGKIMRVAVGHYKIRFGSALVRYARRRHFENKLHPNSLLYLKRAGDSVGRGDVRKYLS